MYIHIVTSSTSHTYRSTHTINNVQPIYRYIKQTLELMVVYVQEPLVRPVSCMSI